MNFRNAIPNLLVLIVLLFSVSCNNSTEVKESKGTSKDGTKASVEVDIFDPIKLKDQIVEVVQNAPETNQVVDMLNEAGASYIKDLAVPAANVDKYITTTQQSLGLGLYGFDLYYANVYDRVDIVLQTASLQQDLIDKLGLTEELKLYKNYTERIAANKDNKDSIDYLVTAAMNHSFDQFYTGKHPGVLAISFIASNIEALYILSQLALMAEDNSKLLNILSLQDERVKSVFSLMELMSGDENVKPYYEDMIPVAKFFLENPKIGNNELKEVAPMIKKIRSKMI